MSKFFVTAALAVTTLVLAVGPASAQRQQPNPDGSCPPGLNRNGPYCETRGPVTNCPPGTQPQGVYCESVGNSGNQPPGQGGTAGFSMSSEQVDALKRSSAAKLLADVNAILKRAGLDELRANQVLITNTTTGFVITLQNLRVKTSNFLTSTGVPVAVVGCTVRSCPIGYNVRFDLSNRSASAASTGRRAYMPHRKLIVRGGETTTVNAKLPRTRASRRKVAGARSATIRIVQRTRNSVNGSVVNRTVKTVKVRIVR